MRLTERSRDVNLICYFVIFIGTQAVVTCSQLPWH